MGLRERGPLRPGRPTDVDNNHITLGDPLLALRDIDIDLGPSVSVSFPSDSSLALEVAWIEIKSALHKWELDIL